jgi:magnesium-dependent phosphatase 1
MPLPRIVVFDLDACCWTPEMYQIGRGAPFKYDATKCEATASGGDRVRLLGDVRSIWGELHSSELFRQTDVAIASRCDEPQWARELLSKFEVLPGVTMIDVANPELVQIHSGNKKTHFAEISKSSGGVAYADMLFFDDDPWNVEQVHCLLPIINLFSDAIFLQVGQLGVKCILTPDGVTRLKFSEGLQLFH